MENSGEATIHPDGSSSFTSADSENPPAHSGVGEDDNIHSSNYSSSSSQNDSSNSYSFFEEDGSDDDSLSKTASMVDPAWYLMGAFLVIVALYGLFSYYYRSNQYDGSVDDDFFATVDCDKFDIQLPAEVEEYRKIRAKCEQQGWEPGVGPTTPEASQQPNHPHRILASALMKRAMADIPHVTKIQKDATGMSKLYARSMCSVKQWKSFQLAEALIGQEVADVRAEADDIEPGWSHSVWQQANQYHGMLKKKHEMELQAAHEKAKAMEAASAVTNAKAKNATAKANVKTISPEEAAKAKEKAAQKAAEELLREEEREKKSRNSKAFASGGGIKKGFMENNNSNNKGGKKK